ncbi:MAG: TIGR03936 family radical SAM-associated protein [Lachnospiraceae bacterium]
MKIRIKFAKRGVLKFVGHLDIMRYFQKLIRRSGIDISYSEGFNPHQKMSFAQPLGVGMLSEGEYVDIEVNTTYSSKEAIKRLNDANVPGIEILSYKLLDDNAGNAMASVAAADYEIIFRDGYKPEGFNFYEKFTEFFNNSPEVNVIKETKKSVSRLNIKPYIYNYSGTSDTLKIRLSTGSAVNIKPELVMDAFYRYMELPLPDFTFIYTRLEVYGNDSCNNLIPLMDFGKDIL